MDQHPFDKLSRALAAPRSRRGLLKQLGVALAGVAAASVLPRATQSATPCVPGLVPCGGNCVDLLTDKSNCGACGQHVPQGGTCTAGVPQPPANNSASGPPVILPQTMATPVATPNLPNPPPAAKTCAFLNEYCDANTPCCDASALILLAQYATPFLTPSVQSTGLTCNFQSNTCTCADFNGFPTACGKVCCAKDQCCNTAEECVTGSFCDGVCCGSTNADTPVACDGGVCRCTNTGVKACYGSSQNGVRCCDQGDGCNEQGDCVSCPHGQVFCIHAPNNCCPPGYTCPGQGKIDAAGQNRCCTPSERPCFLLCCPAEATCSADGRSCVCPDQRAVCNLLVNGVCCPIGATCVNNACVCKTGQPVCGTGSNATCCGPTQCCDGGVCVAACQTPCTTCFGGVCVSCTAAGLCCQNGACVPQSQCSCNAQTCPTGCCQGNTCQPGNTNAACGTGGGVCQSCGAGQTCATSGQFSGQCVCTNTMQPPVNGQCVAACSAATCPNGCCLNGACSPGLTSSGCGTGGGIYAVCGPSQFCSFGQCVTPGPCVQACPPGQCWDTVGKTCVTGCGNGTCCGGRCCATGDVEVCQNGVCAPAPGTTPCGCGACGGGTPQCCSGPAGDVCVLPANVVTCCPQGGNACFPGQTCCPNPGGAVLCCNGKCVNGHCA